jgi:superoxide dismutase, Fe-Mn family
MVVNTSDKTLTYVPMDFPNIKGLQGIPDQQIEEHMKLYMGYVKRTNDLIERLGLLNSKDEEGENTFQELKRRLGWEFNGMRLHELYFEQFFPGGKGRLDEDNPLGALLAYQYGNMKAATDDFMATAKMPGVGWTICYQDPMNGQILNVWVEQHNTNHPAGCRPILVLDCWEHAFMVYKKATERADYIKDWMNNIDWEFISSRLYPAGKFPPA